MLMLSQDGSECVFPEPEMFPGVTGYAILDEGGQLWVPSISAVNQGSGAVGRFLDWLPIGTIVPTVLSAKLEAMLKRRGFEMKEVVAISQIPDMCEPSMEYVKTRQTSTPAPIFVTSDTTEEEGV